MGILTVILVATVVVLVYFLYDRGKQKMTSGNEDINTKKETIMKETENNGQENAQNTQDKQERNFHTKDFLLETLQKMNVNYEFSPDDETRLWLEWQGGHFAIDTANDNPFIEIWFLQWEDWELYDIDTISRVKRIINDVNIKTPITVVYSVNEAASTFSIHSKKQTLFIPQIPEPEKYLQSLLSDFFLVCRYALVELDKLKNQEEAAAQ